MIPRIGIGRPEILLAWYLEADGLALIEAEPARFRAWRATRGGPLFQIVRIHRPDDVGGLHLAAPDRGEHVFDRMPGKPRQRPGQIIVGILMFAALAQALDDAAAEFGVLGAHRVAGGAPHRGPRLAGGDEGFPGGRRRRLGLGGDDLDFVAVLQFGGERRDLAVDLAADGVVADVGMHRIGEIDRRRLARQRDQLALGRETEHLVLEQLQLGMFEKLLRVGAFGQQRDGAAQPPIGIGFARQQFGRRAGRVLVERMSGDAVFGDLVHFLGADLQFDPLVAGPDDGGMDRAVIVLLGRRDVVLEAPRHHRPGGMHNAERLVALRYVLDDDAEAENIGQLLEADRLALHLAPDRIGPLAATLHARRDATVGELAGELRLDLADQALMPRRQCLQPFADDLVGLRIELPERQAFQLLAHFVHADAAGERRIDIERLLGDAAARLRLHVLERAHIVQPVGELDQQHPHVLGDRQQEFAQVLGLLGFARHQVEPLQLGEAFHQVPDVGAEQMVDLGAGGLGILDRVMQQRRRDGGVVELVLGKDRGDFERMGDIGVAGQPPLFAMRLHGIHIGAVEKVLVRMGIVLADAFDQVVLPDQRFCGPRRRVGRHAVGRAVGQHFTRLRLGLHTWQIGGAVTNRKPIARRLRSLRRMARRALDFADNPPGRRAAVPRHSAEPTRASDRIADTAALSHDKQAAARPHSAQRPGRAIVEHEGRVGQSDCRVQLIHGAHPTRNDFIRRHIVAALHDAQGDAIDIGLRVVGPDKEQLDEISGLLGANQNIQFARVRHDGFEAEAALRFDTIITQAIGNVLRLGCFCPSGPSSVDAISSGLIYSPKSKSRLRSHRVSVVFPDPLGPATIKTNGWFKTRRSEPITPPICAALSLQGTRLPGRATVRPHRNLRSGHWENSEPVDRPDFR